MNVEIEDNCGIIIHEVWLKLIMYGRQINIRRQLLDSVEAQVSEFLSVTLEIQDDECALFFHETYSRHWAITHKKCMILHQVVNVFKFGWDCCE